MSKAKHLLKFLPAVLWYSQIWRMSAQTAGVSSQSSGSLMGTLFSLVSPAYSGADPLIRQAVRELVSFYIRKGAHMFLFFVLAILIWYGFSAFIRKRLPRALCTILPCAALAALDEYHQTFVPGRSGEVRDVFVDLSGSLIALLLFALPVIALWLGQKMQHPDRVWLVGALCGTVMLVYTGLLTEPAPFFTSKMVLSPLFTGLNAPESAVLLASTSPTLRQLLYLFVGAVTGFLSVCLATLSKNHRAILAAFLTAVCLTLLSGIIWTLPTVMGLLLSLIGGGAALVIWMLFPLLKK